MGAPTNGEIVPGSQPTTAQIAPTPGLVEMDKAARVRDAAAFNARGAAQNNAQIEVIRNPAGDIPDTAEPAVLGQHFTQALQDIDAKHASALEAGRQALTQQGEQAAQAARGAVQGITQAVGGTTAPDVTGPALRTPLIEQNAAARAAENKIWRQYNPDGKLAMAVSETPQTAKALMQEIDPGAGDVLGDRESILLKSAASLPDVAAARTIQRLRSNIGQLERSLRAEPGNEMALRRLGMLKSSIDNDVTNGVSAAAAANPEVAARIHALGIENGAAALGERGTGVPPGGALPGSAGRENGFPGQGGAERPQGGGPGGVAGNSPMAPAAATQGANPSSSGLGANGRRLGQPQTLTDFLISRGGVKDQGGEMRGADLQAVHHRMGGRLINNTKGMPLDYAREAAAEAGFIRPNADLNEFLDAVTSQKPVYRISEAADAGLAAQQSREAALTSHARFNAGANVDDAISNSGVRLSPAEQEHAIDLHMQGMAPLDAVQQAARAGEENVLQRNAEYNAVGSPGVPLAARQAEMPGMRPQSGLVPNITPEDAAIWASARQATLERKQTFGQGPVGAVLRPGKQGAEFNVENAAVARQFLTGNSTEPARVQKFIDAVGGEPQAVNAMREALVSDLRQKRIIDEDGMVKADRLKGWLAPEARGRTVDLFPGLRDQLGSAETAQRAYDQTVADHATRLDTFNKQAAADHIAQTAAFKKTGGQFANAEPMIAFRRLLASDTPTETFATVVNQAKGNPAVLDGLKRLAADYIEQKFSGAKPSGDDMNFLLGNQLRKFIDARREPLKVIFGGQGLQNLEMVGADLRRQAMATAAPATPGSDTAQKLTTIAKEHGEPLHATAMAVLGEQFGEIASHIVGKEGISGKVVGLASGIGAILYHTLKQAGISTKADLRREALLHPAVAKELMARASSNKAISAMSQRRIARAIQATIVNNAIGQSKQEPTGQAQ